MSSSRESLKNPIMKTKNVPTSCKVPLKKTIKVLQETKSDSSKVSPKKYKNDGEISGFVYENILFKETGNGKIECGVCQVECSRLILHMNKNEYCTEYFSNMVDFKLEYSRYRHKQSQKQLMKDKKVPLSTPGCSKLLKAMLKSWKQMKQKIAIKMNIWKTELIKILRIQRDSNMRKLFLKSFPKIKSDVGFVRENVADLLCI